MLDPTDPDFPRCRVIDTSRTRVPLIGTVPTLIGVAPTIHVAVWDGERVVSIGPFTTIERAQGEADAWLADLMAVR